MRYWITDPRREPRSVRQMFQGSLDVLDGAEILRRAAISMRESAKELDRLANELDPSSFDSLGAPDRISEGGNNG
jgi:hypothetical protein